MYCTQRSSVCWGLCLCISWMCVCVCLCVCVCVCVCVCGCVCVLHTSRHTRAQGRLIIHSSATSLEWWIQESQRLRQSLSSWETDREREREGEGARERNAERETRSEEREMK